MSDDVYRVADLQQRGWLLVEDGNHGESRPRSDEFGKGGWRFIRAADLEGGRVLFEHAERINDVARARIRKGIGAPGDVLFSHKGTVGKLALAPPDSPPFVCSPQTTFWRTLDEKRIQRRYLYYFLASPEFTDQWQARKDETDMAAYVSLTAQRELFLRLPPIKEQKAIAELLGTLDDKIELNRHTNAELEALASGLFRSWFIDFEPVHARQDSRCALGLSREATRLFPRHLSDSSIGPIPFGWRVEDLDKTAEFLNGLALQNFPPAEGRDLPVIKIAQLRAGQTVGAERASADIPPQYVIGDGDVIFSWSGSLLVDLWCGGPGALNQHLFKVTPKDLPKWLVLLWLKEHLPEFQNIAADKATTMGHIRRHHLSDAKVVVPDGPVLSALTAIQEPLLAKVIANRVENRSLEALRDSLLPALVSGELTVKQADKAVTEVA